jgi:hypothetical protein
MHGIHGIKKKVLQMMYHLKTMLSNNVPTEETTGTVALHCLYKKLAL